MASEFRKSRQKIEAAGGERNRRLAPVVPVAADDQPPPADGKTFTPASPAKRVGVKLEKGWHKRNFFVEVFLPSLLERRNGTPNATPLFPKLADGQIGITWVGTRRFCCRWRG